MSSDARAVVLSRRPLRYGDGADPGLDRPPHARAASAVVPWRGALWVIQDDALWLARVTDDAVEAVPLPAPDGVRLFGEDRGNKAAKLDLESAIVLDGALVALGSGSTPARERAVVVDDDGPRLVALPGLYAAVRSALPDAELNVEGAVVDGDRLRVLQRGNGAGAVDALVDLDLGWLRAALAGGGGEATVLGVRYLHLGHVRGVRLTPTDVLVRDGALWLTVAAEDSPDTYRDGEVVGAGVAWVAGDHVGFAPLVDGDGVPLVDKVEGLAPGPAPDELWLVTDADDPGRPAELLRVRVERG